MSTLRIVHVSLVLSLLVAVAAAAGRTYTDPEQTDGDFSLQGEYVGKLGDTPFAAQVVALGQGKFRCVAYHGGLPGDGWDEQETIVGDGEMKDGVPTFAGDQGTAKIVDGKMTVYDPAGVEAGVLERITRESPTLGAKPPEGAVVLFDGGSADAFEGGQTTEDGLLMNGAMSKHKFQDCLVHVEFRTPYQPEDRGQGRGNSGCYLQGRYEVQILDSFGLEGQDNECGGIYGIAKPKINMCFPPLTWQTYDIEYIAARFDADGKKTADAKLTVKHNGVTIHEGASLPHATTAAPVAEGPEPGPLYLQDHGNPVRYRNVWVVER
jgi:hypothetical protein